MPAVSPSSSSNDSGSYAIWAVVSLLLGLLVAILGFFALMMWLDARDARDATGTSISTNSSGGGQPMAGMDGTETSKATGALTSFAGAAPENADELATAHRPFPAALAPAPAGPVANVNLVLTDINVQVAPGVKYAAWAWAGGAPGPVIHVRQGQLVKITLTNKGAIAIRSTSTLRASRRTRHSATCSPASPSATASVPMTPVCSCTTAGRSRC
jgi:hypothetical protein